MNEVRVYFEGNCCEVIKTNSDEEDIVIKHDDNSIHVWVYKNRKHGKLAAIFDKKNYSVIGE